jgi:FemAB-related protein (PEP-CTERM system-associated)
MATDVLEADAVTVPTGGAAAVSVGQEPDRAAWEAFVQARTPANAAHAWAWRGVIARAFGHECVYLIARSDGRVSGVLPLVFIRSRLFGRSLTSMPFLNYGGVMADDERTARALVDAAGGVARERSCGHVELRHVARRFEDLPSRQHKVSMWLPLEPGLWERLDRKVRNQVRKAEKSGLTVARGGAALLDEFYAVFSRNMRDLGTPVYGRPFFAAILDAFGDAARLIVVRKGETPVAAGFTLRTGAAVEIPWASSIREYNALCPNHLLYWHALETATAEGATTFDFGRSTPGEGTYKFKEQWGAAPIALHWEYVLTGRGGVPDQGPTNPKFRLAIAAWKRLPLWAANAAGPRIVRGIP